ncbi:MAG: hypothetical protein IJG05_02095 [Solobacterium sp.]|nr:hypothetical protein [Solobacterium sp.]
MKRILSFALCILTGLLAAGCTEEEEPDMGSAGSLIVGRDIAEEQITEFYYTYENINYNAFYQRYRFYVESGKYMFFHETRERPDDYGPASEKDRTSYGTFELTEEEWDTFYGFLKDGTVKEREESLEDGDSGPWTYLYWDKDGSVYQEYTFSSLGKRKEFESFCEALEQEDR